MLSEVYLLSTGPGTDRRHIATPRATFGIMARLVSTLSPSELFLATPVSISNTGIASIVSLKAFVICLESKKTRFQELFLGSHRYIDNSFFGIFFFKKFRNDVSVLTDKRFICYISAR